jgi:lipopolysaccharide assembly outer membrane protein LptD (OstA)
MRRALLVRFFASLLPPALCLFFSFAVTAPAHAQLHALDHSVQDSLLAKAVRDSVQAHRDSVKADSLGTGDDTVSYSAKRIRYRQDRFSLSEKALLTYRGSSLTADSIVFYSQDNVVEAIGAPLIQDPANPPIQGYRMRYNLKTKVGEIYYGSSKKGNQTFNGVEVRRQKNGDILIARGDFSTCDVPQDKHYFFYSRRMILEPKSKVLSGPIVMNIGDVPVAILPMMVMPLGSGRRSGLLQPKVGGDQTQGFYINGLGYYWAINDYTDYLASGDVIEGPEGTFDRTNLNSTFRYNKRYEYNGSLGGKYYVREFNLDPAAAGWSLDYAHDQNITPDQKQTLKGTGRFQSDPDIVRNSATDEEELTKQTANATLGYRRQFDWNNATFNADFAQDYNLTTTLLNRDIPNLSFRVSAPLFPKPDDEVSLSSGEEPWYRKLTYNYDNRFNVNMVSNPASGSFRGDTNTYVGYLDHLSLAGKYPVLNYFNFTPSVSASQTWTLQQRGDSAQPVITDLSAKEGIGEYFAFYSTSASLDTRIYGIAQAEDKPWFGKLSGIRHTISPLVSLTYAPKLDSNPRFLPNPKIGVGAFQAEQKTVGFSLANDLDVKLAPAGGGTGMAPAAGTPGASGASAVPVTPGAAAGKKAEPYKVLSANSSINYNFAREVREWSDIPSTFNIYLTKNVAFTLSTLHKVYDDFTAVEQRNELVSPILSSYSFGWRKGIQVAGNFNDGVRIKDTQGFPTDRFETTPWSMDMNYNFAFTSTRVGGDHASEFERLIGTNGTFQRTRTHSANGSLKLNPTPGWQMSYDTDYNFSEGKFSRHSFAFHRVLHCWQMDFRWTPEGLSQGWNFNIRITDLPDVKLETSDTRSRRVTR